MVKYRIVSYCPDTHIEYDGRTPYDVGVGGGITARVRMAKALRKLGHDVKIVVNCQRHEYIDGVEYIPLEQFRKADADVLILNTSGGEIDLSPAADLDIRAALRIIWLHGTIEPKGLESLQYDYAYAVSNFVADAARQKWSVTLKQIFVTHNAYEEQLFADAERSKPTRDPYRIVYFSHPSKGLDTAIEIVRLLRESNSAFHLEVFGGNRLWGERDDAPVQEEGITYHGLIGQDQLAKALLESSFALQLQSREEPFGISLIEAQRAGCIVLASMVGAYAELIRSGINGFLLMGDHRSMEVRIQTANLIIELVKDQRRIDEIRRKAMAVPLDTRRTALTWLRHWDLVMHRRSMAARSELAKCKRCGGLTAAFPDGYHCMLCGLYSSVGPSTPAEVPVSSPMLNTAT